LTGNDYDTSYIKSWVIELVRGFARTKYEICCDFGLKVKNREGFYKKIGLFEIYKPD